MDKHAGLVGCFSDMSKAGPLFETEVEERVVPSCAVRSARR